MKSCRFAENIREKYSAKLGIQQQILRGAVFSRNRVIFLMEFIKHPRSEIPNIFSPRRGIRSSSFHVGCVSIIGDASGITSQHEAADLFEYHGSCWLFRETKELAHSSGSGRYADIYCHRDGGGKVSSRGRDRFRNGALLRTLTNFNINKIYVTAM